MTLAARTDAILAGHTGPASHASVTVRTECAACNGRLHVDRISQGAGQTHRVHHTCIDCGAQSNLVVGMPAPRLSWRPLERHLPAEPAAVAERLDIHRETATVWRRDGVPADRADHVAHRLGVHPTELWGMAYYLVTGIEDAA